MSGLLIGILLSRTLSGFMGAWIGWRGMFLVAAGIGVALLILMQFSFPSSRPRFDGTYGFLMRSLFTLFKQQKVLREAASISFFSFATFGLFWTTMVLHFAGAPFYFHSDRIGMFGLAAVCGALVAPLVGGSADRNNPRTAIGFGIGFIILSFVLFAVFSLSIAGFVIGIVLLDLGLQCIHVSNQSRVFAILPAARNRLNTIYMTISFTGTASGSAIGLLVWDRYGWLAVCIAGVVLMLISLGVFLSLKSESRGVRE